MKKLIIACALALCAAPLVSVADPAPAPAAAKQSDEARIKTTVTKFFDAFVCKGDIDKAQKYMSKSTKQMFDGFLAMAGDKAAEAKAEMKKQAKPNAKFEVTKVTINGATAKAKVKMSVDGETAEEETSLVKEDGEWKINVNKEEMQKDAAK